MTTVLRRIRSPRFASTPGAAVLALGVCGGLLTQACSHEAAPPVPTAGGARAVPVRTAKVDTRDLDQRLELTGTLKPRAQVQVVAEVNARLLRLLKDEGSHVADAEVIAVLDSTDYRLALDRSKAALAVAQANRNYASTERERADNLLKTGGITDKDHLAAQVSVQVAEASLAQAKAEVAIAEQAVSRCQVKAPFAGHIARRLADAGSMLATGSPIVSLVDDSVLEFRASVPSADFDKVKIGATVDVTVDAIAGFSAKGQVVRMTPLVDERSRSFEVVVRVPGTRDLMAGLFARAAIQVRTVPGALVVPPSALVRDGARPELAHTFVVVLGKAERRDVRLGVEIADAIQVTEGLAAGDTVVVDPPVSLASGAQVEVRNSTKAPQG